MTRPKGSKNKKPRKKAPEFNVAEYYVDDSKRAVDEAMAGIGYPKATEKYRREAGGRKVMRERSVYRNELGVCMHPCLRSVKEHSSKAKSLGYEPVIVDGEQSTYKGDLLWMRPEQKSREDREIPALVAKEQLDEQLQGNNEDYTTVDAEGGTHGLELAD